MVGLILFVIAACFLAVWGLAAYIWVLTARERELVVRFRRGELTGKQADRAAALRARRYLKRIPMPRTLRKSDAELEAEFREFRAANPITEAEEETP